jgi:hypothetical protein
MSQILTFSGVLMKLAATQPHPAADLFWRVEGLVEANNWPLANSFLVDPVRSRSYVKI